MSRRAKLDHPLDRGRFPLDPWRLVESIHREGDLGITETLFTVANGYLGMRGNPEEGRDAIAHGTFINGFHETWPIRHAEAAFGFARRLTARPPGPGRRDRRRRGSHRHPRAPPRPRPGRRR